MSKTGVKRTGDHRDTLGTPILVTNENDLHSFMAVARRAPILSVDTESNSLYAYYHQICLIQVSFPGADYLIDPLAVDILPLNELFSSPQYQKIFHAAENDILGLKRDFDFEFANIFDTMMAARILGWPRASLAAILQERYGIKTNKRLQRANWGRRPIPADLLAYAQLDTHYLLSLRNEQEQELRAIGRWEEALETFERLPGLEWSEKPFNPDAFWKINGARELSHRERAILKEVFLYREQRAQQLDRPPFKVLNQRVLLTISQNQPANMNQLRDTHGLSAQQLRRHGKGIVQAVERGQRAPFPEQPRRRTNNKDRPTPEALSRYEALRGWRKKRAQQRGVDSDIVFTNDTLMTIARLCPATMDELANSEILGPWKLQEYGAEILDIIASA
ncbi:MAG: HRDC domain-containing protein [Chloroflexota bacterium]|nr:HRDC domain-containing protein [Chloroflexota bacterium]